MTPKRKKRAATAGTDLASKVRAKRALHAIRMSALHFERGPTIPIFANQRTFSK